MRARGAADKGKELGHRQCSTMSPGCSTPITSLACGGGRWAARLWRWTQRRAGTRQGPPACAARPELPDQRHFSALNDGLEQRVALLPTNAHKASTHQEQVRLSSTRPDRSGTSASSPHDGLEQRVVLLVIYALQDGHVQRVAAALRTVACGAGLPGLHCRQAGLCLAGWAHSASDARSPVDGAGSSARTCNQRYGSSALDSGQQRAGLAP